jgi:hypothetical protein
MVIHPKFREQGPVHGALADLIHVGHQMAKAKAGDRGKHKMQMTAKVHELVKSLHKHHPDNQKGAFDELVAEAAHDKVHMK